ncbi:hypothetical protein [Legionella sainthelensi]|nr:hypothetical protein [Legionella sainthelensi]
MKILSLIQHLVCLGQTEAVGSGGQWSTRRSSNKVVLELFFV